MTAEFAFATWREAAQRLNDIARKERIELHPLPYRRFDPEADSTWWLAPTTDNPAYAEGKIVIEGPSPQAPRGPFVGLHIEKGVGPAAAEMFAATARGRRLLMDDGWIWRAFTREMVAGNVDSDLAAAVEAAGDVPVLVTVVTAIQDLPSLEQGEDRIRGNTEHIWYRPREGELKWVDQANPGEVARLLGKSESLGSLAEKILSVPDLDWRWAEVMIGIPFEHVAAGGMTPSEIWRRACAPWRAWLR